MRRGTERPLGERSQGAAREDRTGRCEEQWVSEAAPHARSGRASPSEPKLPRIHLLETV